MRRILLLLMIWPETIYCTTVCQGTRECFGNEINENEKIYCASYYSCASSTMNANSVLCEGNFGCKDADITSIDVINCVGHRSCYSSNIKSNNNVYCDGKYVCQYATISAQNIYIYGDYGANYADIDSLDLELMNIYSTGHLSGNNVNIYCRSGSICNLYCYGSGCLNTNYFCFVGSKCLFNCNEANHCPIVYNDDNVNDKDLGIIVDTKKKDNLKYKLQQQAKLENIEQEMVENYNVKHIDNNMMDTKFNNDKPTLTSTLIIIGELIMYSFVIMIVTYYCCYIKKKNKDFGISPLLLIGNKHYENDDDLEAYLQ